MAIAKARTFLDTAVSGLVIIVEHNLKGVPDLFFTEWTGAAHVYVSLFDPRIAEVKTLDSDRIQVTFASAFAGYLDMLVVEVDNPSVLDRVIELEKKYLNSVALIEDKVSKDQWIQMNTLLSSQIENLQNQIDDLQSQINMLSSDVDAL